MVLGNVTDIFVKLDGRYFTFRDVSTLSHAQIISRVRCAGLLAQQWKKQAYACLIRAERYFSTGTHGISSLKGVAPMNANIIVYAANPVKSQMPVVSKRRAVRHDIAISDIKPAYLEMSWHIDKQLKGKQPVRIPTMNNQCLGQFLRCLELRKSWI